MARTEDIPIDPALLDEEAALADDVDAEGEAVEDEGLERVTAVRLLSTGRRVKTDRS